MSRIRINFVLLREFDEFAKQLEVVEVVKRSRLEIDTHLNRVEEVTLLKSVGL
jgi:hypothetical protein